MLERVRLSSRRSGASPGSPCFSFEETRGRLVEICGQRSGATATAAALLARDAQARGELVVWVVPRTVAFFPPDLAEGGVDLASLLAVRVEERDVVAAAELAARSGAFGLVLVDLGARAHVPMAALSRFLGLARAHASAIAFLTEKPREHASLGSLVSLRADASRARVRGGGFELVIAVTKDKRRAMGWTHVEGCRGPAGLR